MRGLYTFARTAKGAIAFARVALESQEAESFSFARVDSLPKYLEHEFGNAVRDGISMAMEHHVSLGGGKTHTFKVREFTELVTDTTPDAVLCATAAAAWKPLSHSESEVSFEYESGWKPTISSAGHPWDQDSFSGERVAGTRVQSGPSLDISSLRLRASAVFCFSLASTPAGIRTPAAGLLRGCRALGPPRGRTRSPPRPASPRGRASETR